MIFNIDVYICVHIYTYICVYIYNIIYNIMYICIYIYTYISGIYTLCIYSIYTPTSIKYILYMIYIHKNVLCANWQFAWHFYKCFSTLLILTMYKVGSKYYTIFQIKKDSKRSSDLPKASYKLHDKALSKIDVFSFLSSGLFLVHQRYLCIYNITRE